MSRQLYRVPLDFDHPPNQVWPGFLMPADLIEPPCPACENGYSERAADLMNQWHGHTPFAPERPLRPTEPAIMARSAGNIADAPDYYGHGPDAVLREAQRLADLWNRQWCHHLTQDDVDALVAGGRLKDFTHVRTRADGWAPRVPTPQVTADAVNAGYLLGFGHDAINAHVVISARCKREGVPDVCGICHGMATAEAYPGQRAAADAWKRTDPPAGDGWQLWETASEGSPVTPVFATSEALAQHIASTDYALCRPGRPITLDAARALVGDGWAPSGAVIGGKMHTAENAPLAYQDKEGAAHAVDS